MLILLKIPLLVWLVASALCFAGGEYYSKVWALSPNWRSFSLVLVTYTFGTLCWLPALLHKNELAVLGTIWLLLGCMATVIIGTLVFHETLSPVQWGGIVVGIIGLAMLAQ